MKRTEQKPTEKPPRISSAFRSLLFVVAAIFCVETAVMFVIHYYLVGSPGGPHLLVDSFVLCLILSPILYFFQYRPMLLQLQAQQRLQFKLEKLINFSAVPIFVLDKNHTVLYWNKACVRLTGITAREMVGTRNHWQAFYREQRDCLADVVIKKNYDQLPGLYDQYVPSDFFHDGLRAEGWIPMPRGAARYFVVDAVPIYDEDGELVVVIETIQDISGRKNMEDELARLAATDSLTGLCNRHRFEELLLSEVSRAKRYHSALSLIMFDLDYFKNINDTYGHNTGDAVLRKIAEIIQKNVRETDLVARWGGEEFLVLCPEIAESDGVRIAEKLRALVEGYPFETVQTITISCGVTQFKAPDTMDSFISRADDALYRAKEQGRNKVAVA